MLEIEEIRRQLQDRYPKKVADACGISKFTVMRIRDGKNQPSYRTAMRLSNYLEGKPIEE